jgi:hypothetical protein
LAFFLICRRYLLKIKTIPILILFSLGSSLATVTLQSRASYHTGYNYGGWGIVQAANFVRKKVPDKSIIIAPSEIIHYANMSRSNYLHDGVWTDLTEIRKRLLDEETSAFVISLATNTVDQVKAVFGDKEIQGLLSRDYAYFAVGTFDIWIRKTNAL